MLGFVRQYAHCDLMGSCVQSINYIFSVHPCTMFRCRVFYSVYFVLSFFLIVFTLCKLYFNYFNLGMGLGDVFCSCLQF